MSVQIAIIGTGYVGLVSGACLAELGHDVICVDNDTDKINALNNGRVPIFEPGLDELVSRNVGKGSLRFSFDLPGSVRGRDAVFITVGTPSHAESDRANLDAVMAAAEQIASNLDQFAVVVMKSTVPVGTSRIVQGVVERCVPAGQAVAVASNPEFLRQGCAINDFMHPDRIVIGAEHEQAIAVLKRIFDPLERQGCDVLLTEIETAEVIKYASNAFLAVKISYINEIADLCEAVGADVDRVAAAMGLDHRIGAACLKAGPGWGGSCFPKDTRALRAIAADHVVSLRIVDAAIEANMMRRDTIVKKIEAACGGGVARKRLAVFGLTFKGETDDVRESPSIEVIRTLAERGARIRAYDPSRPAGAVRILPGLVMASCAVDAIKSADALIVLTDWKAFRDCDLEELVAYMSDPVLIDLRNLFDEDVVRSSGFRHYVRIGRKAPSPRQPAQTNIPQPAAIAEWVPPKAGSTLCRSIFPLAE
ncbi:UDP-glucose dehydrogenase family protein [Burkholderia sp. MR1-5-21]